MSIVYEIGGYFNGEEGYFFKIPWEIPGIIFTCVFSPGSGNVKVRDAAERSLLNTGFLGINLPLYSSSEAVQDWIK